MKRRVKEGALYEIHWDDAKTRFGWHPPGYERPMRVQTVGYATDQSQKQITLAQTRDELGSIAEATTIPRVCISKIRRLR